jgi:hypothetical protein
MLWDDHHQTRLRVIHIDMLEVVLIDRRGRGCEWQVRDQSSNTFMAGREKTRQAARYAGNRALFQLLAIDPKLIDLKGPM